MLIVTESQLLSNGNITIKKPIHAYLPSESPYMNCHAEIVTHVSFALKIEREI